MIMQVAMKHFVELNKRHGCTLQMGGSDQWGNIVNGVELGRRMKRSIGIVWSGQRRLITTSFRRENGQDGFWRRMVEKRAVVAL